MFVKLHSLSQIMDYCNAITLVCMHMYTILHIHYVYVLARQYTGVLVTRVPYFFSLSRLFVILHTLRKNSCMDIIYSVRCSINFFFFRFVLRKLSRRYYFIK